MDKILDFSKKQIKERIKECDIAIDATLGRGNDSLFLSGIAKKVYAFDIQDEAIEYSKELFKNNKIDNVTIINDSHENISNYISNCDIVMFNLGYLPKGDKSITTMSTSSLKAIKEAIRLLNYKGIISIIFYPGCPSGKEEVDIIIDYLKELNQKEFDVIKYDFINQINNPPFCVLIERIR